MAQPNGSGMFPRDITNRFPVVSASAIFGPLPLRWRFALVPQWLFDGGQHLAGPADPVPRLAGDLAQDGVMSSRPMCPLPSRKGVPYYQQ